MGMLKIWRASDGRRFGQKSDGKVNQRVAKITRRRRLPPTNHMASARETRRSKRGGRWTLPTGTTKTFLQHRAEAVITLIFRKSRNAKELN